MQEGKAMCAAIARLYNHQIVGTYQRVFYAPCNCYLRIDTISINPLHFD